MRPISFKRHRFPPEIIRQAIWLYARFTLSFRDIEELLAERGIDASYETVRRWFLKFGPSIAANIRRSRPRPSDHWHPQTGARILRRDGGGDDTQSSDVVRSSGVDDAYNNRRHHRSRGRSQSLSGSWGYRRQYHYSMDNHAPRSGSL